MKSSAVDTFFAVTGVFLGALGVVVLAVIDPYLVTLGLLLSFVVIAVNRHHEGLQSPQAPSTRTS